MGRLDQGAAGAAGADPDDLLARLAGLDTTLLVDAGPALRLMDPGIRAVAPGRRLLGRAVTVAAADDFLPVLGGLAAAGPGDVLVVETTVAVRAMGGELVAREAIRRGLAGIVIDGFCRDIEEIRRLPLAVYARGSTARGAPAVTEPVVGVPIRCGGVRVEPGDLLVGDEDGIVVGSTAELAGAVDAAEAQRAQEAVVRAAIVAGESLFDRFDYEQHLARLRAGSESRLRFLA
jgi:regulator of RNase E activity RraA